MAYEFVGKCIKDTWTAFCVKEIESIRKGNKPSLFGSIPVFSYRTVEVLKKYLNNNTEILVSDEFRNKVLSHGLQEFLFREVWDS